MNLPFVDFVEVEIHDQRQAMLIQTRRGAEAVQSVLEQLGNTKVGRVITREPTLEDAYVRLVGGDAQ